MIKVDKGIPLPGNLRRPEGGTLDPPLRALASSGIGDSIVLDGCSKASIYTRASIVGGPGWVAVKAIDKRAFRVWKKAEPGAPKPNNYHKKKRLRAEQP
jgi:hypothetical protein